LDKKGFDINEQILLLPCLSLQMQDSEMENHLNPVIGSGAAESTESHTWMHSGTSVLHGFIQLICGMVDRVTKRGSNPIPKDENPDSYREIYEWVIKAHRSGTIVNHLIDGFLHFRAVDVRLTAGTGYAWNWNKTVLDEEKRRDELVKETGREPAKLLLEEFSQYTRPEKEVRIPDVIAKFSFNGGIFPFSSFS